jgi:hypothetical protein
VRGPNGWRQALQRHRESKICSIRDPVFDQPDSLRYLYREALLDRLSDGGERTEDVWAAAERLWHAGVADLTRMMSTKRAEDAFIAANRLKYWIEELAPARGWERGPDGSKFRRR